MRKPGDETPNPPNVEGVIPMRVRVSRVFGLSAMALLAFGARVDAQVAGAPRYRTAVTAPPSTYYVVSPPQTRSRRPLFGLGSANRAYPARGATGGRTDAYGRPGLPRGQVYYGGRYFGSFNNRFYGPQYGYF